MELTMWLNDVHSALNKTPVATVEKPISLAQLSDALRHAREQDLSVSVAGGRHAMGGQQFLTDGLHIDTTALNRVLSVDTERGLLEVEAGIMWPDIIAATHTMAHPNGGTWAIRQKQTGVDEVTLAGSISAAAHGRGLLMQPIGNDIESLNLVDGSGAVIRCSRSENAELFSLVIGGYGLFGIIYSAELRLTQRQKVVRVVDVIELEDASNAIYRRVEEGCLYGDFQYAIDHSEERFMRKGVFACYRPAPFNAPEPDAKSDLPEDAWLKLLALAHTEKTRAFKMYAGHYLQTDGNVYWSDTMQLSTYIPNYADFLHQQSPESRARESLVIGEHYVPPENLLAFIHAAREILVRTQTEVIYGTLRLIQPDETAFLAWAQKQFVCVIFNLRTPHNPEGIARTQATFQALTDASTGLGGSFFLTYHRFATAQQVEKAHPKIRQFFALKKKYDPDERFQSDWYLHYRAAFTHA
jgi:FAD/FMN-containing dehydrogenase